MTDRRMVLCLRLMVGLLGIGVAIQAVAPTGQTTILLERVLPDALGAIVGLAWAVALVLAAGGRSWWWGAWATAWAASMCVLNALLAAYGPFAGLLDWDVAVWRFPLWVIAGLGVLRLGERNYAS